MRTRKTPVRVVSNITALTKPTRIATAFNLLLVTILSKMPCLRSLTVTYLHLLRLINGGLSKSHYLPHLQEICIKSVYLWAIDGLPEDIDPYLAKAGFTSLRQVEFHLERGLSDKFFSQDAFLRQVPLLCQRGIEVILESARALLF